MHRLCVDCHQLELKPTGEWHCMLLDLGIWLGCTDVWHHLKYTYYDIKKGYASQQNIVSEAQRPDAVAQVRAFSKIVNSSNGMTLLSILVT